MPPPTCQKFCCSDFVKFVDPKHIEPADLLNEISTLFAREHFDESINYSLLEQSLRLVSRWLSLDSVVRLIVVMAEGELKQDSHFGLWKPEKCSRVDLQRIHDLQKQGACPNVGRYAKEDQKTASPAMRKRAQELLQQAKGHIQFVFKDFDLEQKTKGAHGITQSGGLIHSDPTYHLRDKSEITIHRGFYTHLESVTPTHNPSKALPAGRGFQLLLMRYQIARLLIHETFHALQNLYNGNRKIEFFYENASLAKCGYAVENAIFGGILEYDKTFQFCKKDERREASKLRGDPPNTIMMRTVWPSTVRRDEYQHKGLPMGVRDVHFGRLTKVTRVPIAFANDMFTTKFWERRDFSQLQVRGEGDWTAEYKPSGDFIEPGQSLP